MAKVVKKRRGKGRGKKRQLSSLRRWLYWLFGIAVLLGIIGLVVLDRVVYQKFSGKKWSLPSHVYSRPLELYQGLALSRDQLKWELDSLGYQRVRAAKSPSQYSVSSNRIELFSRGFEFWDGTEKPQLITVSFNQQTMSHLTDSKGKGLTLARLEPMVIGGIYPDHKEDRELVKLLQLPPMLPLALVAIEDQDFYQHHGISFKGITRAFIANIKQRKMVQGGSTLTQQLVKNFYLNEQRTITRKMLEAVMAVMLEVHFSKDDILETYFNEVYLGQSGDRGIHGFGLASRYYFGQSVTDLKLHQVALLAGLVKGASYYNPRRHPERALRRRNLVLDVMAAESVISATQAKNAKQQSLGVIPPRSDGGRWQYPGYLDLVKRQLHEDYNPKDLRTEGLRIFTNFDPQVQRKLEEKMTWRIDHLSSGYGIKEGKLQGASVIVRVGSGEVIAIAGGKKSGYAGFNRALDAQRPIGSTIKPAVYLSALEIPARYTLATQIEDEPISVTMSNGDTWQPRNYDRKSHGLIPLYEGLGYSYNQATAKLGLDVGLPAVVNVIQRLGYTKPLSELPSILLGAIEMSPFDVAQLYHTIATNGFYTPLRSISSVFTADNTPLKRYSFEAEQRFDPVVMHLINYGLQVVLREGTGKSAYKRLPENLVLAGKTGTTNEQRDSWFAGFSGNYLSVIWMGRDDNGKTPLTGGTGALQLWIDIMATLDNRSVVFRQPAGIHYYWVEEKTGLLSQEGCAGVRYLPFIEGSEPTQKSSCSPSRVDNAVDWLKNIFGW